MTIKINDAAVNDFLDTLGALFNGGVLEFRTGAQPANAGVAATGTVVATLNLPNPAFSAAAGRSKAKTGTWEDTSADASGTIGYARMRNVADTRRIDFSVTATGGGGDITVDNTVLAAGQDFIVTSGSLSYP